MKTVSKWMDEVEGLSFDVSGGTGDVVLIRCDLCARHEGKLRALRNFSASFVKGITGNALKKDNVVKHGKSDMNRKAVDLETNQSLTLEAGATADETSWLSKLFDLTYLVAKEELPFSKYPTLFEIEKRHGVRLGSTYATEHKCRDFVVIIGETMREKALDSLKQSKYFSVLMDGSTDSSITEKELMYVQYLTSSGKAECMFLKMKDILHSSAAGIKECLEETFGELGLEDYRERMVALCVDGAAVNLGIRRGVAALLREDMPWLVATHCLNHRLELGVKDALNKTYMDEVTDLLTSLYYVYSKSPKRLRELKHVGEIIEEGVNKPEKAHGTRWIQHKSRALQSLIKGYPVIAAHLETMASENSSLKSSDKARFKAYYKKLTSFRFVLHLLFFEQLLGCLGELSCDLQSDTKDFPSAIASLDAFYALMDHFQEDPCGEATKLSKFVESAKSHDGTGLAETVSFKNVKLSHVSESILQTFLVSQANYFKAVSTCLKGRFDDLKKNHGDVIKGMRILDTNI